MGVAFSPDCAGVMGYGRYPSGGELRKSSSLPGKREKRSSSKDREHGM